MELITTIAEEREEWVVIELAIVKLLDRRGRNRLVTTDFTPSTGPDSELLLPSLLFFPLSSCHLPAQRRVSPAGTAELNREYVYLP